MDGDNLTLCVPRSRSSHLAHVNIVRTKKPDTPPPNHVVIAVDRFGFSTNNITYQALGEEPHFRYFDFHPAPTSGDVSPETHGVIPVWGFGTIVASAHPKIFVGERVYGYLAPTRYLVVPVSPSDVNQYAFYVPRPHLPADRRPYNQITRCSVDPPYDPSPEAEDLTMLYRPLFWTSYWCADWIFSSPHRLEASRVLISSASSKTAFCLAYAIRKRDIAGMRTVGLTSTKNLAFTKSLGLYDDVVEYDKFPSSPALRLGDEKWIYADVTMNDALNERVLTHFGIDRDSPSNSCLIAGVALGLTHFSPSSAASHESLTKWSMNIGTVDASQAPFRLQPFFTVEWLHERRKQMPSREIARTQTRVWKQLMADCKEWIKMERSYGGGEAATAFERVVAEGFQPDKGLIWSLWERESKGNASSKL